MIFRSRRIAAYVSRELFTLTVLGVLLYTFVLLMNHFLLVAEKALSKRLGLGLTLHFFASGIPRLLVLAIPMAVLLGTLIAVGRLSADHEWVALQSAGRGPGVLLGPVVGLGVLATLVGLVIYGVVVPRSNYTLRNIRGEILFASNLAADVTPRVFYTGLPDGTVLFVDEIRPGGQRRLERVLVMQEDRTQGATELILARHGDLYPAPDRSGDLFLDLYDGVGYQYDVEHPESYRPFAFGRFRKKHDAASYLRTMLDPPNRGVQDFSMPELWREYRTSRAELRRLERAQASGAGPSQDPARDPIITEVRARAATRELHQRVALPMASLLFAMLALPLGIHRVRSGKGAGFALSLLVILIYWFVFRLASDQAWAGNFPAMLGPWMGNLVILAWALAALWRMRWSQGAGVLSFLAWLLALPVVAVRRLRDWWTRRPQPPSSSLPPDDGAGVRLDTLGTLAGTGPRFVGRLDQFIGAHYLRVLLVALGSAFLVYGLVEMQGLMDGALRTQSSGLLLLRYLLYFVPSVLPVVLPISCLVGAVVAFTVLARRGELVAIKASGVSLRRATLPILVLTLLFSAGLFLVQDRIAPIANRNAQQIRDQIMGRPPRTYGLSPSGSWSFGPEGRTLYHYRLYDPVAESFQGLSVFNVDRAAPRILDHRFSQRARWTGQSWELEESWYRTFPTDGSPPVQETHHEKLLLALDPPTNFTSQQLSLAAAGDLPEQLNLIELREQIDNLSGRGYDVTRLRVAYHGKFAQALAPLVMVLLGLPFAFKVGQRGSLYGVGVALLLVLVYWAAFAVFNALGLETVVPPYVAAWTPNVLFGLFGVYLLLYVRT